MRKHLLDQPTLMLIHKELFGKTWSWAGRYRHTQKSIGVETYKIHTELKILKDDVEFWLNNRTFELNEIAARLHHRLVFIHPFPNGNGRWARVVTDLFCEMRESPLPTWGASKGIPPDEIRKQYISALRAADKGDHRALIEFIFE